MLLASNCCRPRIETGHAAPAFPLYRAVQPDPDLHWPQWVHEGDTFVPWPCGDPQTLRRKFRFLGKSGTFTIGLESRKLPPSDEEDARGVASIAIAVISINGESLP
jgi:hypothetical protein